METNLKPDNNIIQPEAEKAEALVAQMKLKGDM